jgi:hypothetical protein
MLAITSGGQLTTNLSIYMPPTLVLCRVPSGSDDSWVAPIWCQQQADTPNKTTGACAGTRLAQPQASMLLMC